MEVYKAYSILSEKTFSEDAEFVYVEGVATTPKTDRIGDVVEPLGARFETPMPLLLYHEHKMPVGQMVFATPTKAGIPFKAQIPKVVESGRVKERVDEAIHSLKYKLITAVSIGFTAVEGEVERLKSGGLRFKIWQWLELSLVVIPANSDAIITAVKTLDREHLPSAGHGVSTGDTPTADAVASKRPAFRGSVKLIPRKRK